MVRLLIIYHFLLISFVGFVQEKAEFEVKQMNPELSGDAYSPVIFGNKIVFCGNKKDRVVYTVVGKDNNEPSDLYFFPNENPAEITRFSSAIRTEYYDGPVTFNDSGTICIVSQNIVTDRKFRAFNSSENRLGLNEYVLVGTDWIFSQSLPFNDTSYNCTHPFLAPDGKTLYFSSNRFGGFGGYDLWKSEFMDSSWSDPVNLGSTINTAANEVFPTVINEKLYFSSNRDAFGGLDMYLVNSFTEIPEALAPPLNSAFDDFGIVSNDRLKTGYFSTNRTGKDAIWSVTFLQPVFEECDSLVVNDYCYVLAEENALTLDEIPSLIYQWDINGEKRNGIEIDYCFAGPGQYMISLNIIDTIIHTVYANQAQYELIIEDEVQPIITSLDSVATLAFFQLSSDQTNLPDVEIEDYYWSFSDGFTSNEPNPTHRFTEKGTYRVELGILGTLFGEVYEDCVYKTIICADSIEMNETSTTSNHQLQFPTERKKAAFSDETFLLEQKDSSEIIYVIEIASSKEKLNVDEDLPEDLREDYFIKSAYNQRDSLYSYYIGEFEEITDAHTIWYEIVQRGHEVFVRSRKKDETIDIPLDQAIIMKAILFESNEFAIQEEFKPDLDQIILWMNQVESLSLVISAHTDNVGNKEKNKKLSQKRASAILTYFVENGIHQNRLEGIGYGEEKPIDTNGTIEGRSNNRRVEFELKIKQ